MKPLRRKIKFAIYLFLFCCTYWILDSAWSFLSFEQNLSTLMFQEPMSYTDTLLLKVPPYQAVSRLMVVAIFIISGIVISIYSAKRKKMQKEKVHLERQLQLAQKMESLGTLAGGIAHDFNNILYGALGYTDLCLDDAPSGTVLHGNLQEIRSGLKRAKSLVNQILAFSRQSQSDAAPTEVAPVVDEALQLIRSTLPTTIKIQARTEVPNSTILGDPTQIHQVIMNLCTNAADAMEKTGGTLKINLENVVIGPNGERRDGVDFSAGAHLKITINDTGEGIPLENLNRVFDPFFTSKEQGKGTGMGLAVVHGIVQTHKGTVSVQSWEGHGTTFKIYFPLLKDNNDAEKAQNRKRLPKCAHHVQPLNDPPQVVNM